MNKDRRFLHRLKDFDLSEPGSKRRYNEELFTPVSQVYPRITRLLSFGRDAAWKRSLVDSLPEVQGATVLDLACGPGDLAFLSAEKLKGAKVTGIDLNESMLEKARENLKQRHPDLQGSVSFATGDMGELGFPDGHFDVVTGGYALRNAPDLEGTLGEIRRVLKPGGTAAFLEFSKTGIPLMQGTQLGLLSAWGRLWGSVMHGNGEVYGYIAESLRHFPDSAGFRSLLEEVGFSVLRYDPVFLGFLRITVAERRPSGSGRGW